MSRKTSEHQNVFICNNIDPILTNKRLRKGLKKEELLLLIYNTGLNHTRVCQLVHIIRY